MAYAFQALITDHAVVLLLSLGEWTPRRELPPEIVDTLIGKGFAKVMFKGRHGDDGGDGITLTATGWQEVARIQERLR
jgi:hypothetical protein